ncbi:hypothetical protein [Mycoplasma putrefaciens]|uniref:Transmembrane protein n=1 Tax=Mycoplasma putrefaciens Mput9231 TaxID=1292033 RepID=M9WC41_9MOLU|nr:hypothetical protein [Mycoplasma putrefaciens]AGJ90722.1 Hypothetical protein, predicted transmembrane protein [Mycoplasma putrefaciens Mput9231]
MIRNKKAKIVLLVSSILALPVIIITPIVIVLKNKEHPQSRPQRPIDHHPTPVDPDKPNDGSNSSNKPEKNPNEIRIDVLNQLNKKFEERVNTIIDTINLLNTQKTKNDELKQKIEYEKQRLQKDIDNLKAHTNQDGSEFKLITEQLQHQISSYQQTVEHYNKEIDKLHINIHKYLQIKAKTEKEFHSNVIQLDALKQELENLNSELTRIKQDKEQKIAELASQQERNQTMLSHLKEQLNSLIANETDFNHRIAEREAQITGIEANITTQQQKIEQQNMDISSLEKEKERLENNLKEQATIKKERLKIIQQLISEILRVENEIRR